MTKKTNLSCQECVIMYNVRNWQRWMNVSPIIRISLVKEQQTLFFFYLLDKKYNFTKNYGIVFLYKGENENGN